MRRSLLLLLLLACLSLVATSQEMIVLDDVPDNGLPACVHSPAREASTARGDVNGDNEVTIADVNALIDIILGGSVDSATLVRADVNADNEVTIADINTTIEILLDGPISDDADRVMPLLNGVYRSMYTAGWSTNGNTHQCFGISAYNLMAEVMGDDMIIGAAGNGWFWYDAAYDVKTRYPSKAWRSYDLWTAYYTWIGDANNLLQLLQDKTGATANYIRGQAYAIRAYSYFMLAQSFARTYAGHENDPCVPLYTGTNFTGTTGNLRSTVAQVYAQIDSDISNAVNLLNGTSQQHPIHIGYAVALGLKARIAMVKEDWTMAFNAASAAISASGKQILEVPEFIGLNDAYAANVIWGADIPTDGNGMYASLWTHMSSGLPYGQRAPKQVSPWLYNKMGTNDARRAWWNPSSTYSTGGYVQQKIEPVEGTTWDGDYIWMRVEEMYLTAAEAACRQGLESLAKDYLLALMSKRDPNYSCNKTGTSLSTLTTVTTGSLLEEILIQRRLELWGEDGRIYTIRRLHQGFERTTSAGWPSGLLVPQHADALKDPESYAWVMTIPASEFFDYYSRLIHDADQNPVYDYPDSSPVDVERSPQHLSFSGGTRYNDYPFNEYVTLNVPITRANVSDKPYYALIQITEDGVARSTQWEYAVFEPYSTSTTIVVNLGGGEDVVLGKHIYTLSLTDLEMSVANSSQQTTKTYEINRVNVNPQGQHISFEKASQTIYTRYGYVDVPITLTRADATHDYKARLYVDEPYDNANIYVPTSVVFMAGESTATIEAQVYLNEEGDTKSFTVHLSDEDIATGNPDLGAQITSHEVVVKQQPAMNQNISFVNEHESYTIESDFTTISVPLYRILTDNTYIANVVLKDNLNGHVVLKTPQVVFYQGDGQAYAELEFKDLEPSKTYSCVLELSSADVATSDPTERQITSTTIDVTYIKTQWDPAGTCEIVDYTWGDGNGNPVTATNVPIVHVEGTNRYRIVSPLYYLYKYIENSWDMTDFEFYLNSDGSITIPDGTSINYWGYYAYYNTRSYSSYCYVTRNGNTYDVNFLLQDSSGGLYTGGHFTFIWNRN